MLTILYLGYFTVSNSITVQGKYSILQFNQEKLIFSETE